VVVIQRKLSSKTRKHWKFGFQKTKISLNLGRLMEFIGMVHLYLVFSNDPKSTSPLKAIQKKLNNNFTKPDNHEITYSSLYDCNYIPTRCKLIRSQTQND
jgi:hypothetical protein